MRRCASAHSGWKMGQDPLTEEMLIEAVGILAARDADLARIAERYGPPPLWGREPGFPTLIQIILEQQVSLASARAAFNRLLQAASPLTPESFLALDDAALKDAGFSRQKAAYGRHLAQAIVDGRFDPEALAELDDARVREELVELKGIGHWSADIYLLMALRRPDAWPAKDLALAVAVQEVKRLPGRPNPAELEAAAEGWRPWRAVAARLLWSHYLGTRRKGQAPAVGE